jgi:predicted nucleic acid-binding Zn ribbon protein
MRKANDKTLKEALEQMFSVYKIKRRYDETSVIAAWPELMGKPVANRTKQIYIYEKKLFLRIESSVVKNEVLLMSNQIIEKINEKAGSVLIESIVFL